MPIKCYNVTVKLRQKPPYTEQAQYAAFAYEADISPLDRRTVLDRLGEEVFRSTVALPDGSEHLIRDEYPAYLRRVGVRKHDTIQGRTELLENFDHFEPAITQLKEELRPLDDRDGHPAFVNAGGNMRAFEITVDGMPFIVREDLDGQTKIANLDARIITGVLTKGLPHTEQIVAASYTKREVVAERAPGCELNGLTSDEMRGITDDQIKDLIDTIIELHRRDITIDFSNGNNAFYDPTAGYTFIDLDHWPDFSKKSSIVNSLMGVAAMLSTAGNRALNGSPIPDTSDGFKEDFEIWKATKDLLNKYQEQACRRLPAKDQATLRDRIKTYQVDDYKDTDDYERRWNPEKWYDDHLEAA